MFAQTHKEITPLLVEDKQGMELSSIRIKFVVEDTESNVVEVDKVYVELNKD